jgi:Flp pilus assembly protein TadG
MIVAYPTFILAILFLTGLALDAGNLMLATLSLQGATDAAVISGLRSTLLGNDKDEVEDLARKVLIANLRTEKWDEDRLEIDLVDLTVDDGNFKMGVSYDKRLWLMSALSQSGSSSIVRTYSEGQTPEIQMAVIVDSSYSSRDPRATGVPRLTYSLGVFLE